MDTEFAIDLDGAFLVGTETFNAFESGGFAGTVGAEETKYLTRVNLK